MHARYFKRTIGVSPSNGALIYMTAGEITFVIVMLAIVIATYFVCRILKEYDDDEDDDIWSHL